MPEQTGRLSGGDCLDPGMLSAYVDGTLDVHERAEVEAHLARCPDCYDVMSEVLRIQGGIRAARPLGDAALDVSGAPVHRPSHDMVVRGAFGRRKAVWGVAGTVLAAAAALVRLQPVWWTGGVDPKLADLVEAVGEERTVEARLSGGFKYGPLRSPARSGGRADPTDNWSLLAAAGRIREVAEKHPTPENLHAAGVASLLIGDLDACIRDLERATKVGTTQSTIVNDLGAAYYSRYNSRGLQEDLPSALEAVDGALALDPELPEALFNRGLLLERMGGGRAAENAWEAYLRVDGRTQWASEARRHLAALHLPRGDN